MEAATVRAVAVRVAAVAAATDGTDTFLLRFIRLLNETSIAWTMTDGPVTKLCFKGGLTLCRRDDFPGISLLAGDGQPPFQTEPNRQSRTRRDLALNFLINVFERRKIGSAIRAFVLPLTV